MVEVGIRSLSAARGMATTDGGDEGRWAGPLLLIMTVRDFQLRASRACRCAFRLVFAFPSGVLAVVTSWQPSESCSPVTTYAMPDINLCQT